MKITQPSKTKIECAKKQKEQDKSSWQKMLASIIRPPRSVIKDPLKNVKNFKMNESIYERVEYQVLHNNKKIDLVLFEHQFKNGWIILYLHGNSSSKVEAYTIREYLPYKYSLASFDFMGCGSNFEEDSVTLGYRESEQVQTVVNFLKAKGFKVILWGRSMGAATALKYGKASIIVADSAFKSFKSVCKQVAKKNSPCFVPNCLISCLFPCVFYKMRSDIDSKGNYDVQHLDVQEALKSINPRTVIFFLSGDQDSLIDCSNSKKLHARYAGKDKYLEVFKGTHNTKRPPEVLKRVMQKIQSHAEAFQHEESKGITLDFFKETPN